MKTLLAFLFFTFLIFQSCAEVEPIVSDVCEITSDICYYAEMVCENFNKTPEESFKESQTKQELISIVNDLKYEAEFTSNNFNKNNSLQSSDVKYRLLQIRNELRDLYEKQLKKK